MADFVFQGAMRRLRGFGETAARRWSVEVEPVIERLVIDLADSSLVGEAWRTVTVTVERSAFGIIKDRELREMAAEHFGVPVAQVSEPVSVALDAADVAWSRKPPFVDPCLCWNEGQYGRVHREDCPVHRDTPVKKDRA